ncbi:MAG: type II secretion system protein GspF [Deltaproteobacteria bacterium]|nr:MAG: type II secretion system protein GspF [Deltaproteobacteria bacterium]
MPVYEYTALSANGKRTSGLLDADSPSAARQKLRDSKTFPVSLKEIQSQDASLGGVQARISAFFSRVKPAELTLVTRQLATLLNAGFPLVSAIQTLIPQARSHSLKRVLSHLKDAVEEGESFADALGRYPGIFSPVYRNMVLAGESSGTLELVLNRLADISESQQALNSRIQAALMYPILMTLLAFGVLFVLIGYIVPQITVIFINSQQALPLPTRILIAVSDLLLNGWWIGMLLGIVLIAGFRILAAKPAGRMAIDRLKLRLPVAGNLIRKLAVARFTRTLGSLLDNGVSMLTALRIARSTAGNGVVSEIVATAAANVEQGQSLGVSLSASPDVIPYLAVQMIQVGEQSGDLEAMLEKVATVYEREVEASVTGLTALLEPVVILIMGGVVACIVLSILMPIIQMNQLIK